MRRESFELDDTRHVVASQADPAIEVDPWHGIPAEVLDGARPYDTDTAGGCG